MAPDFTAIDVNEINKQMMAGHSLADGSESPKALGERISTFDADAMEADTDLLIGDMM